MPKIRYLDLKLNKSSLAIIAVANKIIEEYQAQGFTLTLRQLYYQFVARDLLRNRQKEYKRLGEIVSNGRLAGLIDWDSIVDRTRSLRSVAHWSSPAHIVESAAYSYRTDKWASQEYRPEVWIEKDALAGVIDRVCTELDVPYFSCRGYTSQSEMWGGAMRLRSFMDRGQVPYIIHLGDHDPSGMDMSRDIESRLIMFGAEVMFNRVALNFDQVTKYNPPANPCKVSDSRAEKYISEFGHNSWELDALEPRVMADLIRDTVLGVRDQQLWEEAVDKEDEGREQLALVSKTWTRVTKSLQRRS